MQQRLTSSSSRRTTAGHRIFLSTMLASSTPSVKRCGGETSRQHPDWPACLTSRPSVVEPAGEQAHSADRSCAAPLIRGDQKIDAVEANLTTRIDSLRTETVSLKGEVLAEIRRLDTRIDGVDRELRIAIDIRERLAALEARHAS